MNAIEREINFKKWLEAIVDTPAPMSSYPKALRETIPEKLSELSESEYSNLFLCTDIEYLKNLQNRLLKKGDLHEFNISTQSKSSKCCCW
jgi:5-methylcytosine-specific restriction enzyme B